MAPLGFCAAHYKKLFFYFNFFLCSLFIYCIKCSRSVLPRLINWIPVLYLLVFCILRHTTFPNMLIPAPFGRIKLLLKYLPTSCGSLVIMHIPCSHTFFASISLCVELYKSICNSTRLVRLFSFNLSLLSASS